MIIERGRVQTNSGLISSLVSIFSCPWAFLSELICWAAGGQRHNETVHHPIEKYIINFASTQRGNCHTWRTDKLTFRGRFATKLFRVWCWLVEAVEVKVFEEFLESIPDLERLNKHNWKIVLQTDKAGQKSFPTWWEMTGSWISDRGVRRSRARSGCDLPSGTCSLNYHIYI